MGERGKALLRKGRISIKTVSKAVKVFEYIKKKVTMGSGNQEITDV